MSYAIGYVIYGAPITEDFLSALKTLKPSDLPELHGEFDDEEIKKDNIENLEDLMLDNFFEIVYSGSSRYVVGWCGVELTSFDESAEPFKLSTLSKTPTTPELEQVNNKFKALPKAIRSLLPDPDIYVVFGSS